MYSIVLLFYINFFYFLRGSPIQTHGDTFYIFSVVILKFSFLIMAMLDDGVI